MVIEAPAKLNLALYVGATRDDGLHRICSLFQPLELADRLTVVESDLDEVICPGVEGPNVASAALAALREAGWDAAPVRVEIEKRIPVAAGLGGGSADAAAVLRLAGGKVDGLEAIAARLGADVTSQMRPGCSLVTGAGEVVEPLPDPAPFGVVLIPFAEGLSAGEVYAEADRLGIGRGAADLDECAVGIRAAATAGRSPLEYLNLIHNDLEAAAISLRPGIGDALAALDRAGAAVSFVTGSGPTAVGLFADPEPAARAAADRLPDDYQQRAIVTASAPSGGW